MKIILPEIAYTYARQLWRYKWLSVGIAWAICVVGWPAVTMIPPRYESSARIYVNADQMLTPLLRGVAVQSDPMRQVDFVQRTLRRGPISNRSSNSVISICQGAASEATTNVTS